MSDQQEKKKSTLSLGGRVNVPATADTQPRPPIGLRGGQTARNRSGAGVQVVHNRSTRRRSSAPPPPPPTPIPPENSGELTGAEIAAREAARKRAAIEDLKPQPSKARARKDEVFDTEKTATDTVGSDIDKAEPLAADDQSGPTPPESRKLADKKTVAPVINEGDGGGRTSGRRREVADTPKKAPARRTQEPEKRRGKITITEALDGDDRMRQRSLASVRRAREREKARQRVGTDQPKVKQVRDVTIPDVITVQELSHRMAERAADVIKKLMKLGIMATVTQTIDTETAEVIVLEMGHKPHRVSEADVDIITDHAADDLKSLKQRPPVITVMGHVDHGKTSLLDAIRNADVAKSESGGITQHIGAYKITSSDGNIMTFIDTPGHEAFTEMRKRGAHITDIVVLVVAADDGIMEQTIEAINHARAAKCPIVVAVNKCDKPAADPTRVRSDLLSHDIITEEFGGDVLCINVAAATGEGIDKLMEALTLQAELLELKANPDCPAEAAVIEARLERGLGSVVTVLLTRGTLTGGDIFVVGAETGRVRALHDDRGEAVIAATPGIAVEVLGLNGTPMAGDILTVVDSEARAREVADYRRHKIRQKENSLSTRGSVEQMLSALAAGEARELPLVIKTDVHGSLEAIKSAVERLGTDQVKVQILTAGVGAVNESDISLADASQGIVVAFNVRANPQARNRAKRDNIEIRYHSIIYELIDDIKTAMSGLLSPDNIETFIGYAEVRQVFNISKIGNIAGCLVTEGLIKRGCKVRLLRDNIVIHQGSLKTLKRFKDEVKDVREGQECGMAFEDYHDLRESDVIECFEVETRERTL